MLKVCEAALRLIAVHGTERLTHTLLAKSAGVSRAWIYKYLGPDKDDLIDFAVDQFGKMFSELERPSFVKSKTDWKNSFLLGLRHLLQDSEKYPWILTLYFRYKGTKTRIGIRIQKVEKLYVKKSQNELEKVFGMNPTRAKLMAELLISMRMGLSHAWSTELKGKSSEDDVLEEMQSILNFL